MLQGRGAVRSEARERCADGTRRCGEGGGMDTAVQTRARDTSRSDTATEADSEARTAREDAGGVRLSIVMAPRRYHREN